MGRGRVRLRVVVVIGKRGGGENEERREAMNIKNYYTNSS